MNGYISVGKSLEVNYQSIIHLSLSYTHTHTHTHTRIYVYLWASLVAQMVKNLPAMQETWIKSLSQNDSL